MEHPEFEVIENDEEISIHFRRITPIYPATEGLSQRVLRSLIHRLLLECELDDLTSLLPARLKTSAAAEAWREIHFPETEEALARARETLVLAEFFAMQMLLSSRRARSRSRTGAVHCGRGELLERFLRGLPFDLTNAQVRVIEELRADLGSSWPMNRLLQGDVGSGKTVVAMAAMLLTVEAGFQAVLMAPTQILAEQHYVILRRWLEPLGVLVSLRTGARTEDPLPLFARAQTRFRGAQAARLSLPVARWTHRAVFDMATVRRAIGRNRPAVCVPRWWVRFLSVPMRCFLNRKDSKNPASS